MTNLISPRRRPFLLCALGQRISHAGENITASMLPKRLHGGDLWIFVGCVDNPAARRELSACPTHNQEKRAPDIWWLDCGNHQDAGQILLGSALTVAQLKGAFPSTEICQSLPSPSLQQPELLTTKAGEKAKKKMSCAELAAANLQSLNINNRIAAEAADMLTHLLVTRNLKRFACEINLAAESMKSFYATPEEVARVMLNAA